MRNTRALVKQARPGRSANKQKTQRRQIIWKSYSRAVRFWKQNVSKNEKTLDLEMVKFGGLRFRQLNIHSRSAGRFFCSTGRTRRRATHTSTAILLLLLKMMVSLSPWYGSRSYLWGRLLLAPHNANTCKTQARNRERTGGRGVDKKKRPTRSCGDTRMVDMNKMKPWKRRGLQGGRGQVATLIGRL